MTVTQTLGVVHGLVGNVKTVLDGARSCVICSDVILNTFPLAGKASSDSIQRDLGAFLV